jgi:hypothetical protein
MTTGQIERVGYLRRLPPLSLVTATTAQKI